MGETDPDGGSDTERNGETEEAKGEAIFMLNRGTQKIIVDTEAEKYHKRMMEGQQ